MTCTRRGPKSWRELRAELRDLGAERVRTNGSHEKWKFDDGDTFIVVCNHLGDSVPLGILGRFRWLCSRRTDTDAKPPPLKRTGS